MCRKRSKFYLSEFRKDKSRVRKGCNVFNIVDKEIIEIKGRE